MPDQLDRIRNRFIKTFAAIASFSFIFGLVSGQLNDELEKVPVGPYEMQVKCKIKAENDCGTDNVRFVGHVGFFCQHSCIDARRSTRYGELEGLGEKATNSNKIL